jgi:hypothetical protein
MATRIKALRPTQAKIKAKKIFGFDIETSGENNDFVMGSIYGENFLKIFWDKREMQKFFYSSHIIRSGVIFATNLGFDFFSLFDEFEEYSKFELQMRGDRFIKIKLSVTKNEKIVFYDTLNFLMASVENLGNILKIPKLPKPTCITSEGARYPANETEKKELEIYNIRDSEITYKFGKFLQDSFNEIGTNLRPTIASTSMSLFRNKYLKFTLLQPTREVLEIMFNAYYGGRTESFIRGFIDKETINKIKNKKIDNELEGLNYYDVNSLYPFVMRTKIYPYTNTMKYTDEPSIELLKHEGFSQCLIIAPKMNIPLLPHRIDGKLCFPHGNWIGWYCHNELRKAIELGYVVQLAQTYYCTESFNPFPEFVDDLFTKRMVYKNQGSPLELIYKILLTSLYGKFAQRLEHGEIMFIRSSEDKVRLDNYIDENMTLISKGYEPRYKVYSPMLKTKEIEGKLYDISTIYYVTDNENVEYASFINPMISAYITAWARLELYRHFENVIAKKGTLYYCDTDSLTSDVLLPTGKNLGELKRELFATNGIIVKPKVYYFENMPYSIFKELPMEVPEISKFVKFKGLSNLKDILKFKEVLVSHKYKYIKFSKFKESLRRDISFNKIIDVEKFIDLEDNKRLWDSSFDYRKTEISEPIYYDGKALSCLEVLE